MKIRSNLKRCPLLKVTKRECEYDSEGRLISEEVREEFSDCYKTYCAAWDELSSCCKIYPDYDICEASSEEVDGDEEE